MCLRFCAGIIFPHRWFFFFFFFTCKAKCEAFCQIKICTKNSAEVSTYIPVWKRVRLFGWNLLEIYACTLTAKDTASRERAEMKYNVRFAASMEWSYDSLIIWSCNRYCILNVKRNSERDGESFMRGDNLKSVATRVEYSKSARVNCSTMEQEGVSIVW